MPPLLALLAVPGLTATLGVERFGVLGLAWLIFNFTRELGFGTAVTKLVSGAVSRGERSRAAAFVWKAAAIQSAAGIAAAVALAGLSGWLLGRIEISAGLVPEARTTILLIALALPFTFVTSAFRGSLEGMQRFGLVNAVMAPMGIATFLLPLVAVLLGGGVVSSVILLAAARALAMIVMAALAWRVLPELSAPEGRDGDLAELVHFGGWASVSTVVSPILTQADRWFITALMSVEAFGFYAAIVEVPTRLLMFPGSVVAALFPALSALLGRRETREAGRLAGRSLRYVWIGLVPPVIFLVAAADPLLRVWLGPDFAAQGAVALRILALGVLMNALAHVPFSILQGVGRPDLTAKLHLAELPLHLMLVWLLVSQWGLAGAAAAWTIRVTADALLLAFLVRRHAPAAAPTGSRVAPTLLFAGGFAAVSLLAATLLSGDWARIGAVAAITLSMLGAGWRYVLAEDERLGLLALLRRTRRS